jgi:uncharacterized protein (UPF0305 family)
LRINAIDAIERVQRRAARFVTNKYRNTSSVGNMLQHLEWRSLQDRRKDSRLNMQKTSKLNIYIDSIEKI